MIEPKFTCPKCGSEITTAVVWGHGWDWDYANCLECGYDGELDTMTGIDQDGSIYQSHKQDFDEE